VATDVCHGLCEPVPAGTIRWAGPLGCTRFPVPAGMIRWAGRVGWARLADRACCPAVHASRALGLRCLGERRDDGRPCESITQRDCLAIDSHHHSAALLSYRLPCPAYALSGRERRGDGVGRRRRRAAESMRVSAAGLLPSPGHFLRIRASFLRPATSPPSYARPLGLLPAGPLRFATSMDCGAAQLRRRPSLAPPPPRAIAACLMMPFPRMPHSRLHPCTPYVMTGPAVSLSHCATSLINSDQPGYSGIVSLACGPSALSTLSCYSVSGLVFNRARSPWRLPWRTGT
jgi:hypothetical protein